MPVVLRVVRGAMAAAIVFALANQLIRGEDLPTFDTVNFFSYFTVLSNLGAAIVLGALTVRPDLLATEPFTILRGAVTLYMIITGIVYNVLLAPQQADVSTNLDWVNLVVHVIGPIVVLLDWFVERAPIKPSVGQTATWLIFPAVWLLYTMVRGPLAEWYPYPFLDPDEKSVGSIIVMCLAIMVAFIVIAAILRWWAGARRRSTVRTAPATA
jgi:hypothetical protein